MVFQKGNTLGKLANHFGNKNFLGRKHSKETIEKMRLSHMGNTARRGKSAKLETKIKMSIKKSGENHPFFCKKLSMEHKSKISNSQKGEKAWGWKGGITKPSAIIRRSFGYREWRLMVFGRDNYTCQQCNARGVYLNAHHIKPFSKYPELRFSVENGITLCVKCHKDIHKKKV